jgi:hypothetical protein
MDGASLKLLSEPIPKALREEKSCFPFSVLRSFICRHNLKSCFFTSEMFGEGSIG